MKSVNIFVFLFAAVASSDQDVGCDDVTSLLQTHVDRKPQTEKLLESEVVPSAKELRGLLKEGVVPTKESFPSKKAKGKQTPGKLLAKASKKAAPDPEESGEEEAKPVEEASKEEASGEKKEASNEDEKAFKKVLEPYADKDETEKEDKKEEKELKTEEKKEEKKEEKTEEKKLASEGEEDSSETEEPVGDTHMLTKGVAEFMGTALFVFLGCGTCMALPNSDAKTHQVSMTFGFTITALLYTFGHYSGGQFNCAVSLGLAAVGNISVVQALVNTGFQLAGSIFGSFLTMLLFNEKQDQTGTLATNQVNPAFMWTQAVMGEIICTFILVYVVLETAVNPETAPNRTLSCVAIGLAVFLAHSVLIPVDGCSINPSRSFGPMVVRKMLRPGKFSSIEGQYDTDGLHGHMHSVIEPYVWQFWVVFVTGPVLGAMVAAGTYYLMHQYEGNVV